MIIIHPTRGDMYVHGSRAPHDGTARFTITDSGGDLLTNVSWPVAHRYLADNALVKPHKIEFTLRGSLPTEEGTAR